jgi:hypothetical protein
MFEFPPTETRSGPAGAGFLFLIEKPEKLGCRNQSSPADPDEAELAFFGKLPDRASRETEARTGIRDAERHFSVIDCAEMGHDHLV